MNIQLIKLVSGEEIVCTTEESNTDGKITLVNPSTIVFQNGDYDLAPYLPFMAHDDPKNRTIDIDLNHIMVACVPLTGAQALYKLHFEEGYAQSVLDEEKSNKSVIHQPETGIILPPEHSAQMQKDVPQIVLH